jgi:hypothetical protein
MTHNMSSSHEASSSHLIFDEDELLYTQGLNLQTLLFGYFQYFSVLFMFLSSLFRPIIFQKIYL